LSVMSPRYFRAAVVAATLVGSLVRMYHIWGSDFPLNDGGMFLSMILDLQRAGYALPEFVSYCYCSAIMSANCLGKMSVWSRGLCPRTLEVYQA